MIVAYVDADDEEGVVPPNHGAPGPDFRKRIKDGRQGLWVLGSARKEWGQLPAELPKVLNRI